MSITPQPLMRAVAVALSASAVLAAGCNRAPEHNAPAGTPVVQHGVEYTVELSRELNPLVPDDRALLTGLPRGQALDAPGKVLVGVFVQAENIGSRTNRAVTAPRLVSAEGEAFRPLPLGRVDPFAYRGGRLAAGAQIPDPESLPAENAPHGALLVYRVPDAAFAGDRPFTLRFGSTARAVSVQLDL